MIEVCDAFLNRDALADKATVPLKSGPPGGSGAEPLGGGASARPQASAPAGLPPPGPGGGWLSRFGGPLGFVNYIALMQQGVNLPLPLGPGGPVPVMFGPGEWERIVAAAEAQAGGKKPADVTLASPKSQECPLRYPKVELSGEVQQRLQRYCTKLREEIAPFGTSRFSQSEWNEFWTTRFETSEGIRLARSLLWLTKGLVRAREPEREVKVRFRGRFVNLLDPNVEPASYPDNNPKIPVYGQFLYDRVVRPAQFNVGSPFTSDETWAGLRSTVRALRGKRPDCTPARNLDGDAYAAFHFLAENLRHWNPRVDVDGTPVDVVYLDAVARGGGAAWDERRANSGTPLGRADFYTTQDLLDARARVAPQAFRFSPEAIRALEAERRAAAQEGRSAEATEGRGGEVPPPLVPDPRTEEEKQRAEEDRAFWRAIATGDEAALVEFEKRRIERLRREHRAKFPEGRGPQNVFGLPAGLRYEDGGAAAAPDEPAGLEAPAEEPTLPDEVTPERGAPVRDESAPCCASPMKCSCTCCARTGEHA